MDGKDESRLGDFRELIDSIDRQNDLLKSMLDYERSWKNRVMQGLMTGLGSTVGVTLVLAIAGYLLKPWADNVLLKPILQQSRSTR